MSDARPTLVFVCLHGAAKSVVGAALARRLAQERGLVLRTMALGVEPDPEISRVAAAGLEDDGLEIPRDTPRRVTGEDLRGAAGIVSFGCDLGALVPTGCAVERWDDVPSVSDGYRVARDAIAARLAPLLERLAVSLPTVGRR